MPRAVPACLALTAVLAALLAAARAPRRSLAADPPSKAEEPLVEQVRSAIDTGVRFLRKEERGQGNWERGFIASNKPGGFTALALLALLNCGVKADDPIIQRG